MLLNPADLVRSSMIARVRSVFNDRNRGETPVVRSTNALYAMDSVIWRVHGDVTTMMIGGVTALLLQMLHPAALAGIWDHSNFRQDMLGRLRRTARFIAVTTYGDKADAQSAIDRVIQVHTLVEGKLPNNRQYKANDPDLLAWVHICEALSFLDAWIAFGEPKMSRADQDRYFAEFAGIARALGADPIPETRADAEALVTSYMSELSSDARTRKVARMVLTQPAPSPSLTVVQAILMRAAIDTLPPWAKRMHGLSGPGLSRPLVRGSARSIARSMRWAFKQSRQNGQ